MKVSLASLLFLVVFGAAAQTFAREITPAAEEDVFPPKRKPLSAYERLRSRSPFEFAPLPQSAPATNPFEGVSLAGYCGRGKTLTVYLLSGKEKKRITVYGDASPFKRRDESGFRVIGIKRGKTLRKTSIILEKDGRQGAVTFDEDTLRSGGGASAGKNQPSVGRSVTRPAIPRPAGSANASGKTYQAPAPFIPGQSQPSQPQKATLKGSQTGTGSSSSNLFMPANLTNQQLINSIAKPNPPAAVSPKPVVPPVSRGAERLPAPPAGRRRVVLPSR